MQDSRTHGHHKAAPSCSRLKTEFKTDYRSMALWWISFLRPPPVSANTAQIEVIIQITDDLRTKFYPDTIDIYFIWSSESLDHSTNPSKLTTWRPEHAHKLLSIGSPPARDGVSASAITWRLGLFTLSPDIHPSKDRMDICFTKRNFLSDILPVYSAPIAWSNHPLSFTPVSNSKRAKARPINIQKQDEIQRVFKLPLFAVGKSQETPIESGVDPGALNPVIIVEKTSFDLDKRAWDSGIVLGAVLSWWLSRQFTIQPFKATYSSALGDNYVGTLQLQSTLRVIARPGSTILELGAGCGVVSVILSTLLSRLHASTAVRPDSSTPPSHKPTQIHATDLGSAIPLITRNIEGNCHLPSLACETLGKPSVETIAYSLDWEDEELPSNVVLNPPDVIMMSDVTYNTASFPALLKTVKNLLSLSPTARVIIAYKERHAAERIVWEMLESDAKLLLHKVEEIPGSAGAPVEIWLGSQAL